MRTSADPSYGTRRARVGPGPMLVLCGLALCGWIACGSPGDGPTGSETSLEPLLEIDLSRAESGVREQLEELRQTVETSLDPGEPEVGDAELAQQFADLGLAYITYEFLEPAEVCLRNARTLRPEDYRWHYLLGYLRMIQGYLPEALDLYRAALEIEPDFLPAILRLGRSELELGRAAAALPWFEQALALEPAAAAALEGLGKVASAQGEPSRAVEHFRAALELEPTASSLHYALAQSYRDLGETDLARVHLEKAGDVAPRIPDPLINPLADLAESSRFYLVQGAEAMDDGNFAAAAAAFRAAVERDEDSFEARRGLAIALDRQGDRDGAVAAFEEGLEVSADPADPAARRERLGFLTSLAILHSDSGRNDLALERWEEVLALDPDQPRALLQVGNALGREGRLEEAIEVYGRLLEVMPDWSVGVLEKRATALVNMGRGDQAVADFTRALEQAPDDSELRLRFAAALEHLGQGNAAAEQRRLASRREGADGDSPGLERARRLMREGKLEEAEEQLTRLLEKSPDDQEARLELASILGHSGRFAAAAEAFAEVREASPRHMGAHRGLVMSLLLDRRYGAARQALQDALRTFPRHAGFALTQVELLATAPDPEVRDGSMALEIALRVEKERRDPVSRQALAFAHAAAGDYEAATALQQELVAEARAGGDPRVVEALSRRLETFQAGRPWIASRPEEIVALLGNNP